MKTEKEIIYAYESKLKLLAVKNELEDVLAMCEQEKWSKMRLIKELLEREYNRKIENKKGARIKAANFSQMKYLREIVTEELPSDARTILPELKTLTFINEGRNLVLYGNPGTGKTHTAIALGIKACQEYYNVLFTSVPQLLVLIREARSDTTLKNLQGKFEKLIWLYVISLAM